MALTLTTELEAVNLMLSAIGEQPVASLSGGTPDSVMAHQLLTETSRAVQSQGWHFNTEKDVTLGRDASDEIILPSNAARVDLALGKNSAVDVVQRGARLYDRKNHTFAFDKDLEAEVIYLLDWEDLPEAARRYIAVRGARVFQARFVGSREHHRYSQEDEYMALADLREFDGDTGDHTVFGNLHSMRILDREGYV